MGARPGGLRLQRIEVEGVLGVAVPKELLAPPQAPKSRQGSHQEPEEPSWQWRKVETSPLDDHRSEQDILGRSTPRHRDVSVARHEELQPQAILRFGPRGRNDAQHRWLVGRIVEAVDTVWGDCYGAARAELDRLKNEPVTEHELQRTKNQFARDYILGRETNQGKALQLGHAVVIHNDITTADGEFDIFQNITAADVQRVARTYFTPDNRTVLTIMPSGKPGAGPGRLGRQ